MNGQDVLLNGELGMIFRAQDITAAEKTILASYFKTTQAIAGCQAIRKRIGHCLFGMRAVYGERIFITVSPNRRHSSMILRLRRVRENDPVAHAGTPASECVRDHAGPLEPPMFLHGALGPGADECAFAEVPFPELRMRQSMNAQDPLSSVHHYLYCMRVLLPAAFGLRMCFNCPHCNEKFANIMEPLMTFAPKVAQDID